MLTSGLSPKTNVGLRAGWLLVWLRANALAGSLAAELKKRFISVGDCVGSFAYRQESGQMRSARRFPSWSMKTMRSAGSPW